MISPPLPHLFLHFSAGLLVAAALALSGCPARDAQELPGASVAEQKLSEVERGPVSVVVVEDPALAEALEREWTARSEGEFTLKQMTVDQLLEQGSVGADAIIYPSGMLGQLVQRQLIAPFPSQALDKASFDRQDIFELLRLHEIRWGERATYAVPLGSPQLILVYRADVLRTLGVAPPRNWAEYQALVEQISSSEEVAALLGEGGYACAEPRQNLWAGQLLLARAAAYARHPSQYSTLFDHNTMEPLIAGPPFVRALDELMTAARNGVAEELSPDEVWQLMVQGRCAIALTWPTEAAASPELAGSTGSSRAALAFARVPGSTEVYNFRDQQWEAHRSGTFEYVPLLAISGRLGSITRESRNIESATGLLAWLAGKEGSTVVSPHSSETTLFRTSHLREPGRWVDSELSGEQARQYASVVESSFHGAAWLFSPRIPGREDYLTALSEAVREAIEGRSSSQQALEEAARRWQEITAALELETQQAAYRHSLGLDL